MRVLIIRAFILSCLAPFALAPQALAATINVTTSATDTLNGANGLCSLREAITNINNAATTYADCAPTGAYGSSDTINIPAGTYTIALAGMNEDLNASGDYDIRRSVAIVGAGTTTINGNRMDGVFDIPIGVLNASISGVTITGGYRLGDGGGIRSESHSMLTVTNSTISSNTADWGGGISNNNGSTLIVTNSTISSNTANAGGGGISCMNGGCNVTSSTISGNTATGFYSISLSNPGCGGGGGIYGPITITDSIISGNTVTNGCGGGIDGSTTVTNSVISGNTATVSGGGLGGEMSTHTVTNSTISGNTASNGKGGGIYGFYDITVTNSTITGNTGCGITAKYGATNINSSTISGNIGGGYCSGNSKLTLIATNSIIANQTSGTDCGGSFYASSRFNLESSTSCEFTGTGDKQNTNPLLGALADNDGPTQTMALLPGSPAIDTGLCQYGVDQRGAVRPQGAGCDIGAFEVGNVGQPAAAAEFYHAGIDHYFMTASTEEATYLDNNASWGWQRTGKTFNIWLTQASAPGNASPVCRFFGVFANGTVGSHFYTVNPGECEYVNGRLDWGWGYENNAFYAVNPAGGACPGGTAPVYRVFNNGMGGAPNHRYMASQADLNTMLAQGWVSEGMAFCGAQ